MRVDVATVFSLKGKRALVTGGGTGLGRQFAATLGSAGASLVLAARRIEPLERSALELRALGVDVQCVAIDVSDAASVSAAFATIGETGPLDVLVNNAGTAAGGVLLDASEEDWQRVLDVNVTGAWRVAKTFAHDAIARGRGGSIINVASVLGSSVQKATANYPASKAALLHLTRAMATEWARYGLRVNALAPGYFRTDMSDRFVTSGRGQAMLQRMPIRRLGETTELTGPLLLLASEASSYMTGAVVNVDGGLSIPFIV
jgi:NAD(P)-dependent dehydrogenase (short-subunit alcohol dehydrogenase family)